ncbi:hypothetical protein ARSEF1564_006071, partial [Beauveria bassiana]
MQAPPTTTTTPPPIRQDGFPAKLVKPWTLPPQKTPARSYTHRILPASADVIEVDLDGRYLCPGLIDCHVHLTAVGRLRLAQASNEADMAVSYFRQPFLCHQMLSRGFTSVRDTGGAMLALKEAIADDVFPGPRVFLANKAISQTGGHGDVRKAHDKNGGGGGGGGGGDCCQCGAQSSSIPVVADGVPACLAATREQLRQGADFIKIMFTAAEVRAVADVADSYGTYVTAHAYTPRAIRHAVDNGVGGIEHGNLLDADTAWYMAARNVWLTPTLITYQAMGILDEPERSVLVVVKNGRVYTSRW